MPGESYLERKFNNPDQGGLSATSLKSLNPERQNSGVQSAQEMSIAIREENKSRLSQKSNVDSRSVISNNVAALNASKASKT